MMAEAARDGGAQNITLRDYHSRGYNVLREKLPGFIKVQGGLRFRLYPIIGNAAGHSLAFLVAQHAYRDLPGAFFPHIFHHHVKSISVNGRSVSETEILAGVLGEAFAMPVGLISGDPVLLEELETRFPWTERAACSKDPKDFETPEKAEATLRRERGILFRKTIEAVKRKKEMEPFLVPGPIFLEVELHFPESPLAKKSWGFKRISDTRFVLEGKSFPTAFRSLFKFLFLPEFLYRLEKFFNYSP